MFYFKSVAIADKDVEETERNIRDCSLRRHTPLDLQTSSVYNTNKNKLFLGLETKRSIFITRLRNPIDRFFPKFIVRFRKDEFDHYKLRLSILSMIIAIFLPLLLVNNLVHSVIHDRLEPDMFTLLFLNILFFLLLFAEYRTVLKHVNKAIFRSKTPD